MFTSTNYLDILKFLGVERSKQSIISKRSSIAIE